MRKVAGTYYTINNGEGTGNSELVFTPVTYYGRVQRALDDAIVTGTASGDECTIHVNQNGHEFVDIEGSVCEIAYNSGGRGVILYTNSKRIEAVISDDGGAHAGHADHFSIQQIELADSTSITSGVDIPGDPGQTDRVWIQIIIGVDGSNLGKFDYEATLSVTGSSDDGNNHYTDTILLRHLCEAK